MKLKLRGKLVSTKGNTTRLKRIINVLKHTNKTATNSKKQWTDFIITMLTNKLKRVGRVTHETAQVNS